jgi:trimeric autotransporter adhesin
MPSTYTLNNGIELIGTGEQSGTWGDTTNTNLGLLDAALDGQVTVALASAGSSGSPNSLPITDGTTSNGRNRMVVFSDSGDLGATAYVQLTPNDAEKIIYIRNSLSGSRSVILFQGTYNASNDYEVPAGTTAVVYFDGAGAGAVAANVFNNAHFDAINVVGTVTATTVTATTVNATTVDAVTVEFDNLSGTGAVSVTNILDEDNMASDSATALATQQSIKAYVDSQVGTVDTLAEILAIGNTTGATDIAVDSAQKVQFRDAAIYINSSVDGQLDIVADTEIQIAATTVDLNGALDVSGTLGVTGVLTATSLDISGDIDVDGTTNLDVVDIDGATQIDATVTVGVDDTGYDVKFFGATAGAYMLWDESADDLILGGAAGLSVNSTALVTGVLTTTAATVSNGGGQFNGAINVGVDDTGYDVKFFGATAGAYMLWDESADDLILGGAAGLSVNSTALVTGVLTTTAATVSNGGGQFNGAINVGVDDTGYDVKFFGATAGAYMLWDESADDLILGGAAGLSVNSTALVTGVLTTTAATVSNGGGQFNGAINVGVDDTGYDVKFFGATTGKSLLWDESADSLTVAGNLSVDGGTIKLDGNYPVGTGNVALGDAALDSNVSGGLNVAIGADALTANTGSNNTAVGYQALSNNVDGQQNQAFGYLAMTTNISGSNNAAFGTGALQSSTTSDNAAFGSGVTAVSGGALNSATTGISNSAFGGGAAASTTSGSYNVAVGTLALKSNTTASNNTAVGYQSLYANTTGTRNTALGMQALKTVITGNYNTAVGYQALELNTGSGNTAVGDQALEANTSGGSNSALGDDALVSNTTGSYNSAFGESSLANNTTADSNTGVGKSSLNANTTGNNNTTAGKDSLASNTTGSFNTAFGSNALVSNTTASDNTAVGYESLYTNETGTRNVALGGSALYTATGNYNTAVGFQSLNKTTTGTDNTAIGLYSGYSNTSGANNTALGDSALFSNTTASDNTAVGYKALYTNTTATRQVAVGYLALEDSNGNGNIGVGYGAGKDITSGTDNVCVGDLAGSSQGGLTTGAGNVFIGTSAGSNIASAGAAANQISIGYNIQGIGDNYFTFGKGTGGDRVYNQFTANATWTRSSDERIKTQITENTNCGLAFITDLRTVTYKWKAGADIDETLPDYNPEEKEPEYKEKMYGFIAQEVKSAMDKNGITNFAGWDVTPDEQGAMQGVSYEMFVIPLIKAIQEQQATITALTARITALENL